jgi:hypothetical protein
VGQADLVMPVGRLRKPVSCAVWPAMRHQGRNPVKGFTILAMGGAKSPTDYPAHFPGLSIVRPREPPAINWKRALGDRTAASLAQIRQIFTSADGRIARCGSRNPYSFRVSIDRAGFACTTSRLPPMGSAVTPPDDGIMRRWRDISEC